MKQVKFARNGYILVSILFYLSGIACITMPGMDRKRSILVTGMILITYGVIKIIGYFSKDLYCLAFQYDFACGLFLIVLGFVVMFIGENFQGHLCSGLGLLVLLDSLLGIQTAMDAKRFGLSSWPVILAASILSGTLGAALIVTNTQVIAGCSLLAEGLIRHYIVGCTVSLSPNRDKADR